MQAEEFGEDARAEHHPENTKQRIALAFGRGGDSCSGAVSEQHHPDTEDESSGNDSRQLGRLGMQGSKTRGLQRVHTYTAEKDRGEHGLEHGEVFQQELSHDDGILCDASLLQDKSEKK